MSEEASGSQVSMEVIDAVGSHATVEHIEQIFARIKLDSEQELTSENLTNILKALPNQLQMRLMGTLGSCSTVSDVKQVCIEIAVGKIPKYLGNAPRLNLEKFIVRKELMHILDEALSSDPTQNKMAVIAVCYGVGGVGKTQIALQKYWNIIADSEGRPIRSLEDRYNRYIWCKAESRSQVMAWYVELGIWLGLSTKEDKPQEVMPSVRSWLAAHSGWLLILDNVPPVDPQNLETQIDDLLPIGGHILMTSRSSQRPGIEVDIMNLEEAKSLICKVTDKGYHEETPCLEELIKILGYLPLALTQAASYLKKASADFSLADYLELYRNTQDGYRRGLLRYAHMPADEQHIHPVTVLWELNKESIQVHSHGQVTLIMLKYIGYLASAPVPIDFLRAAVISENPNSASSKHRFNLALDLANDYALIKKEGADVSMHCVVQAVIQDEDTSEVRWSCLKKWIDVLTQYYQSTKFILENYSKARALQNHLAQIADHVQKYFPESNRNLTQIKSCIVLFSTLGELYKDFENPIPSKMFFEFAISEARRCAEFDKDELADLLIKYSIACVDIEDYSAAKRWAEEALQMVEARGSVMYARALQALSVAEGKLNHHDLKKELLQEAVRLFKQHYGDHPHPDYSRALASFGAVHAVLKEWELSRQYMEEAVKMDERYYQNKPHPIYIRRVRDSTTLFDPHDPNPNDLVKQRIQLQSLLEIIKGYYGETHLEVASTFNALGINANRSGNIEQACQDFEQACGIYQQCSVMQYEKQCRNLLLCYCICFIKYGIELRVADDLDKILDKMFIIAPDTFLSVVQPLKNQKNYFDCIMFFRDFMKQQLRGEPEGATVESDSSRSLGEH